jgi:hypothetical protein
MNLKQQDEPFVAVIRRRHSSLRALDDWGATA